MAGSSNAPASTQTACDRCHHRKVRMLHRVPRQDPCKNCLSAKAACGRLRHKTRPRRTNPTERIRLLTERMHQFENQVHLAHDQLSRTKEHVPTMLAAPSQRSRSIDEGEEFNSDVDSQVTEAAAQTAPISIIRDSQLDNSTAPRVALNEMLAALDDFNHAPSIQDWRASSGDDAGDGKMVYDLTPSDIVNILSTPHTPVSSLPWSNSTLAISPSTKSIAMELLDGKLQDESKILSYKIILSFHAAMILGREGKLPKGVVEHVESIKRRKFLDILSKLEQINFRTLPSLHLLRAQCTGVVILQYLGNVPEAWSMLVAASRTFVALGYDTIRGDGQRTSDDEYEDKETCIARCYQLDRSISLLLHRPPLLPRLSKPMRLSLTPLDSGAECKSKFIQLNLDLTHTQELIMFMTRDAAREIEWKDLEPLHNELNNLWRRLDTWERESPASTVDLLARDIDYLRFRGYATQTILLQLTTDLAKSSILQRVAVSCARKCLESFRALTGEQHRFELIDLSWDLLLYSLSPLCVLAWNIVRTQEAKDLELLEACAGYISTRILKKPTENNPLATRVCNLYKSIIHACRPLVSSSRHAFDTTRESVLRTNHTPYRKNFMNFEHFFGSEGSPATALSSGTSYETNQSRIRNSTTAVEDADHDDSTDDPDATAEECTKLLMYWVQTGWSD